MIKTAKIKGCGIEPPDECRCLCHTGVDHAIQCYCVKCENCGKNIRKCYYEKHKKKCKNIISSS